MAKFLSISFVRQIRLPRKAGEANLPPELLATHLVIVDSEIFKKTKLKMNQTQCMQYILILSESSYV